MNPFRSRKKSFTEGDGSRRPSVEDVPPVPLSFRGRTFRRQKKQPEPKKEMDISTVLPPTDDFRTSLLMPNLSARFSMLREQDDPNTKIGKANDDSVLSPKRVSRLDIFGNGQLSDIAEVSSLSGSIRPPFATERSGSYSSADNAGYGTDDEGKTMMSRSRPGQGNKFFGGRQKVYMIPVGASASMKDLGQAGKLNQAKGMGRAVYDDDINLATYRANEKALAAAKTENREEGSHVSDEQDHRRSSQNSEYNSKRETSSSTNSGPFDSRVSTAATSVASQAASPMNGPVNGNASTLPTKQSSFSTAAQDRPAKGRRLYGQGLDQQIHDQQSSALNRLNSIQRNFGPGMVHYGNGGQSRSATNLNDRYQKPPQLSSTGGMRTMSPIPGSSTSLAAFDFGTQNDRSRSNSRDNYYETRTSPTMSPPMSPTDPTLVAALEPNDLGKATATGAFNKPKTPYSEEQFALRQIQLQEGRETPPPRAISRTGAYNSIANRDRKGSATSQLSGHSTHSQTQLQFGAKVPSLSNLRHGITDTGEQALNGTYLASGSEYESEPSSPDLLNLKARAQAAYSNLDPALRHRKYEHDDQHPAFNSRLDLSEEDRESEASQSLPLQPTDSNNILSNGIDSPTLPILDSSAQEEPGAGLSDLIRGHLRNVSNQSSVYPNSPPRSSHGIPSEGQPTGIQKFPEFNDTAKPLLDGVAVEPLSVRARRLLEHATQLKNAPTKAHEVLGGVGNDKVQQVLGGEAPRRSNETTRTGNSSWQEQLKGHSRGASTETQKEREDFANELADRRKQVQNNLKSIVKEGRSSSPVGARIQDDAAARGGPLGLLKKTSRSSVVSRNDNPSKAMKMLGVNSAYSGLSHSASSENLNFDRNNYGPDSRPRLNPSRSADPSYIVGSAVGPSFRDRSIGAEARKNFSRKTSPSPAPGPERAMSAKTPSPNPNGYGFVRSNTDSMTGQQASYRPAGRARKYSPPQSARRPVEANGAIPGTMRSVSAQGNHISPAKSHFSNTGSYFPNQMSASSTQLNTMYAPTFIDSPRPSPIAPGFSVHNTPPIEQSPTFVSSNGLSMAKSGSFSSQSSHPPGTRKRSINKEEISNPTFLSGTSSMITVDLPPGASLSNGMETGADAPPVPPLNPRRRKGQVQTLFTSFGNKSSNNLSSLSTPSSVMTTPNENTPFLPEENHEEKSTFSADESDHKPRPRNRLRKSSSVGENLSQKARHQALKEIDKLPKSPHIGTTAKVGMF